MADADPKIETTAGDEIIVTPAGEAPAMEAVETKPKRKLLRPLLMFGVPLILLAVVGYFWFASGGTVSTDEVVGRAVLLFWPLDRFSTLSDHPEVFDVVPAPQG